jgi:hypothetical protein
MDLDFLKRIVTSIEKRNGEFPWPVSRHDVISERGERVWRILPVEWHLLISRFNPYKRYRNRGLKALNEAGIPYVVLSEISGIPGRTVERILGEKRKERDV